jgi:transposase
MKAYSLDLRQRIVTALQNGDKEKEIAARFEVSVSTVQRLDRRLRQQESLAAKPTPGKPCLLCRQEQEAFVTMLTERTDWTMQKMAIAWHEQSGRHLAKSTLHDLLGRIGWRFKKRVGRPRSETRPNERLSGSE